MDGTGELLSEFAANLSLRRPVQIIRYPADPDMGYDELSAFVLASVAHPQFVILGESFSGPIAIEVAASKLERVAGLVLASSFACHPLPKMLARFSRLVNVRWAPRIAIEAMLLGAGATPALKDLLAQVLARVPGDVLQARIRFALSVDKRASLQHVTCPMLALHGRFDRIVGKGSAAQIQRIRPDCESYWLDASHMLLETSAKAAASHVADFLRAIECTHLVAVRWSVLTNAKFRNGHSAHGRR
jgi:pimeloyl-ACP methyl ester carboxylesterase